MCYNYSSSKHINELKKTWDASFEAITPEDEWRPVQQVAAWFNPKPIMPILIMEDGVLTLKLAEWVLAAPWISKEEDYLKRRPATGNARRDKLLYSKLWKPIIEKNQTCLVLATGVFEYHHAGDEAIPYYIFPKDKDVFAMPGLFSINKRLGEPRLTYSIITDEANSKTRAIHNGGNNPHRQSMWFDTRNQELNWLSDEISAKSKVEALCQYPDDQIDYHAVAKDFKSPEFSYDERVLRKVDYPLIGLP